MLNLLKNENIYAVIDTINTSIYWKDFDGKYLGCNQYMLDVLGLSTRAEVIGKTDFDLFGLEVAKEWLKNDRAATEKGIFEGEEVFTLANGQQVVYWSVKRQLRDEQGIAVGISGSSSNIANHSMWSELEKQRAILNEKSRISQIIDVVNASIYWKDLNGAILGCNRYVLNMLGICDKKEIVGKNECVLIPEEEAIKIAKNDRSVLENGHYEGEESFTLPSGKKVVHYVVKNQLLDSENKVIGIVATSLDITEKKITEQLNIESYKIQMEHEKQRAILNERLKISQIIDVVNASIYWKDLNGVMLGCNRYVVDMCGVSDKQKIIGKTEHDFMPKEEAIRINKTDQSVLTDGYYEGEEVSTLPSGDKRIYYTVKNRLLDSENNVIGLVGTSLDITSKKEAERLRLENKTQQVILQEQEKFRKTANQVAHDIRSPLSSLLILAKTCTAIPERERNTLREASTRISDIANNLLSNYKQEKTVQALQTEEREPILISPVLLQMLTEKKYEYQKFPIEFLHRFSQAGEFSWINIQHSAFDRMISNLINNAVDAFNQTTGTITLYLDADETKVNIMIEDNGKGMSPDVQQKIMDQIAVSEGKEDGHGIGLTQVSETLKNNQGHWSIDSKVGEGTTIKLTFPRTQSLPWIAETVELIENDTIVILDDDISIHMAWDLRFDQIRKDYPELTVIHFELGQETINLIDSLAPDEQKKIFLLADYELLNQDINGLAVIEKTKISRSILVTSHYANKDIQQSATKLATKILPKQLASDIPIHVRERPAVSVHNRLIDDLKMVDVVFVDDEQYLLDGFRMLAHNKQVDTYCDPQFFLDNVTQYHRHTKIMLDQNFANSALKGNQIAEALHAMGFTRLYLLSGERLSGIQIPHYLTAIFKTDLNQLQTTLNE